MKILLTVLLIIFSTFSVIAQNKITNKLTGVWKGVSKSSGSLKFVDSANIVISIPHSPSYKTQYSIDTAKKPMWFDIYTKGKKGVQKGLLEFIDDKTMKWQRFYTGRENQEISNSKDNIIVILKKEN